MRCGGSCATRCFEGELGRHPGRLLARRLGDARGTAWLATPQPDGPLVGLPRVLVWVASQREDVVALFADDPQGLLNWAHEWGVSDHPALGHVLAGHAAGCAASGAPGEPDPGTSADEEPPAAPAPAPAAGPPAPAPAAGPPWGVNVAGSSAQSSASVRPPQLPCRDGHRPHPRIPVEGRTPSWPGSRRDPRPCAEAPYAVNVVCVNADYWRPVRPSGPSFFAGRHTVGYWWWEVARVPDHFLRSFDLVDEVWCGSRFVADAFAAVSPKPVVRSGPGRRAATAPTARAGPKGFLFLFLFDFDSALERKNPLGLIEAFAKRVPAGRRRRAAHQVHQRRAPSREGAAAARRGAALPHVHMVDHYLTAGERDALLAAPTATCRCTAPRASGLTLAESMFLGKPVVATGWSGNLDFMTPENGYLVDYDLVPVGPEGAPYPADGKWAQPDLEHAARLMREVFDDRGASALRGRQAAEDIRRTHSLLAAAESMTSRLDAVREMAPYAGTALARTVAAQPEAATLAGIARDVRAHRHGGTAPRRALLRLLRPYTHHQDRVTDALVAQAVDLERRLADARLDAAVARGELMATTRRTAGRLEAVAGEARQRLDALAVQAAERDREFGVRLGEAERRALEALEGLIPVRDLAASRPDPATLPFETFDAGVLGSVYGFRTALEFGAGDDRYRRFEDLFRGSEATIAQRQEGYVDLLRAHAPVLDVGCGRGELLVLLRAAGVAARGVDTDAGMVARCAEKGLDVTLQDGVSALEAVEDGALGAVFCAQVIEHLPYEAFHRFFALAARKVRPGGCLIAETVNPHAPIALKHFWLDLTHEQPVFPEVALSTAGLAGFREAFIFHPGGSGDAEADRTQLGDYTLVATR